MEPKKEKKKDLFWIFIQFEKDGCVWMFIFSMSLGFVGFDGFVSFVSVGE